MYSETCLLPSQELDQQELVCQPLQGIHFPTHSSIHVKPENLPKNKKKYMSFQIINHTYHKEILVKNEMEDA